MVFLDKNDFTGQVGEICQNLPSSLNSLVTDCDEVTCPCCKFCCRDSDSRCNEDSVKVISDSRYLRDHAVFSEDGTFY